MKIVLLIILSFHIPLLFAQVSTITISNLPIADEEDGQVCYDAGTGKLGKCSAAATAQPRRIAWVSKQAGGDYDDPIAAMDDLSSWCSAPGINNRCLLRIAPGRYNLGSNTLVMVSHVDIQGSGMRTTQLSGTVASETDGFINGATNSILSDLAISNFGSGSFAATVAANNVTGFYLERVKISASGGKSGGFAYGLRAQVTFGTSGPTHVYIYDSFIEVNSIGTDTNVRVASEVAGVESLVEIRSSELFTAFSSDTSLQVTTLVAGAKARVILEHSDVRDIKRTGAGISNLIIKWSEFEQITESAAFGESTCVFVLRGSTPLFDTCS